MSHLPTKPPTAEDENRLAECADGCCGNGTTLPGPRFAGLQRAMKRAIDVGAAVVGLAVAGLPMLVVAVLIRCTMGRPVLFRQVRPGKDERLFCVYKFRTMNDARGPDGALLPDSQRLTRLGRFLRRTSLDELPQLLNVLKGDMSLVGPRPLLERYLPYYTPRERLRFRVPPGITGLAQISGRNALAWNDRLELDVQYVQRWNLWLDLVILMRTIGKVLRSEGVQDDPSGEMLDLDLERRGALASDDNGGATREP